MSIEKICQFCEKIYFVIPSQEKRNHYCSKECSYKAKIKPKIKKNCLLCDKPFFLVPNLSKKRKYCSRACACLVSGQISGFIRRENRILNSEKNTCQLCGHEYIVKNYERKTTKYCSRNCANQANAIRNGAKKRDKYSSKDYLLSKIKIDKNTDCWNWIGSKNRQGYGQKRFQNKETKTHRIFYEVFIGKITFKKIICHKCDNPSCCNPDHLFQGTHSENMQDMIQKKRDNFPKGEKSKRSIFKNEDILAIRRLYPSITQVELSKRYNCSEGAIAAIIHRRSWRHLP